MIPKIISFYLPQFHEVKENSEWYGNGFTDWVTVRKASPLFPGHIQPKRPLNDNYYDLSNIDVIRWQAGLAREYGIDGFCFYHYWFDSNTRLLEKPAELLLQHKEIDISYCFSWANESWKRTWSNVAKGNVWCDEKDNEKRGRKDRGVLAKQRYGREEEWKKHIDYLIPFFKDERYIKIDEKPVLFIYQPCDIICIKSMMELWNNRLEKEGIAGIYLVGGSYGNVYSTNVDLHYNHEPGTAFVKCRETKKYKKSLEGVEFFDYDTVWQYILDEVKYGKLSCAFTDFDASPRKGYKSVIVRGASSEKFKNYFSMLLKKNIQLGNQIVIINAWNEWGEGMYLEPCENHGYEYLESVRSAVCAVKSDNSTYVECEMIAEVYEKGSDVKPSRAALQVSVLNQWLSSYRAGIRAAEFFNRYRYFKIAIYGMGILGKQLVEELTESNVEISYYMDRSSTLGENMLKKVSLDEELPEVDCIVVTVIAEFENIYGLLKEKSSASIINISEIFEDLF